jgi:excisionase family DNA binding protein
LRMERQRLAELLGAARGVREANFRMEQALLDALSEERDSDLPGNERGRGSDEWFTLAELGDWLKVSRTAAYRLIRERRIPAYRVGRATRVRRRDVERWLEVEGRSAWAAEYCGSPHAVLACHSSKRRQQVMALPQPISWGSISHGMPDLSTNRMPVSAARSGTRGRPPLGLGGSSGSSGSIVSQSSSVPSGLAMPLPYPPPGFVRRT